MQFEREAEARGVVVHYAADAEAHNRIVGDLLDDRGVVRVVKSKSMLTEECRLNQALETRGIEVVDTDLGERIVQLGAEPPSHIVVPAVHRRREEVGALFHRELGTPESETDPARLMAYARSDLRGRARRVARRLAAAQSQYPASTHDSGGRQLPPRCSKYLQQHSRHRHRPGLRSRTAPRCNHDDCQS